MRSAFIGCIVVALVAAACADDDAAPVTTARPTLTASTSPTTLTVPGPDPVATTTTTGGDTTATTRATTTTTPPAVEPRRGGVVVIGMDSEPDSINPLVDGSASTARIAQLHMAGISDVSPDLELVPDLLVELPTVANGGLTVNEDGTMTVRYAIVPEARWSDDVPITGSDFEFTYEVIRDLEGYTPGHGGDADLYSQIVPESVVAGDSTFEFTMRAPTVQHELLFPVVLPRHQVSGTDFASAWNVAPWVSAGPFVLESWVRGLSMTFVRNPFYWKTDEPTGTTLPYLDRVVVRFYQDGLRAVDAFRVREVDVLAPPASDSVIGALAELTPEGVALYARPGLIWEQLAFQMGARNRNAGSLNDHLEFRRAVAHAIDRDAVAAELFGGRAVAADSYLEAYRPMAGEGAWAAYPYDPAEARRLLGEACVAEEIPCDIESPTVVLSTTSNGSLRSEVVTLIAPMLESIGLDVTVQLEDSALFFGESLTAGTFDVGVWAWAGGPGLAPLVQAHDLFDPDGAPPYGVNYQRWGTGAVEGAEPVATASGPVDVNQERSTVRNAATSGFGRLVDRMETEVDGEALLTLVAEAEAILADQVVFVPLFSRVWLGAIWADAVGGYVANPAVDTWNVETWYRLDLPESAPETADEAAGAVSGEQSGDETSGSDSGA